jgi:Domain of unknown function (DUF4191)
MQSQSHTRTEGVEPGDCLSAHAPAPAAQVAIAGAARPPCRRSVQARILTGMARAKGDPKDGERKQGRIAQFRTVYKMTRQVDRWIGWVMLAWALGVFAFFLVIGLLIDLPIYLGLLGLASGLLVATFVFGRRVERATYSQLEGQAGAAAHVLTTLRRGWTVTPAVNVTRNQDVVHRAVGLPGIVLVGEGAASRVANLVANERKRTARVVGPDVPIYEIVAGDGEGEIPLRKLQRHVMRLPRNLRKGEVGEVNKRLRALPQTNIPVPKGPLPRNVRLPKGPNLR